MADRGELETAVALLRGVIKQDERWLELLHRLPHADLIKPDLPARLDKRLKVAQAGRR